jgi:parallel beta-helix repeat protein
MNRTPLLKQSLTIGIILLFFGTGILIACAQNYEKPFPSPMSGNTLYVGGVGPENYTSIQGAIDNASEGDTIYVFQGTYYEGVSINIGNISLIGENRSTTILDGSTGAQAVVILNDSGINIDGFTIINGGDGILMNDGSSNMVTGNLFKQNQNAIRIDGYQSNNLISGNILESNLYGIYYSSGGGEPTCTDFQFTDNIIRLTSNTALYFQVSIIYSTISGNTISDNGKGIEFLYDGLNELNSIYHNNFINNSENADDFGANSWYNTTLNQGNYWSDYTGVDNNSDGIGDTPYTISESRQDLYPYMNQDGWLNIPPIANAGGPYSATAGHTITFTGSKSSDPDGVIEGYRWDFTSDGTYDTDWLSSPTTSYSYSSKGTYTVTLQVIDNFGVATTDTAIALISKAGGGGGGGGGGSTPPVHENLKPVADLSAGEPYQGLVKTPILFDGSNSYDPDGSITTWFWVFSDNTSATGEKVNHSFTKPGTYTISIVVTDTEGAINTDTTTCVIIQPNSPPAKPTMSGPIFGTKNTRYDYTVLSTDEDNDNISYTISWDENIVAGNTSLFLPSGIQYTFSHQWVSPGIYTITLFASDSQTESPSTSLTILIDVKYVKGLGYLINQDDDGIYDMFYSNSTTQETRVQKQADGLYLINSDSDRDWDYSFNPATSVLTVYTPSTPGFELAGLFCALAVMLILLRTRKTK